MTAAQPIRAEIRGEHRSRAIRNGAAVSTETTGDDQPEIRVEGLRQTRPVARETQ